MKNPFDELAKTLAKAKEMPRRDALRLIGGGFAGAVLASFGVGKVLGQGKGNLGNSPCAHFCKTVFPPGPERGKCVSDAAHGTGLCFECGPAAPPDTGRVLCGQVCCETDAVCCDGTCCDVGDTCEEGTCVSPNVCSGTHTCGTSPPCDPCGPLGGSFCFDTTEGTACVENFICGGAPTCTTSADCPSGSVCTIHTCCGDGFCGPVCAGGGTAPVRTAPSSGGMTASGAIV